MVFFNWATMQMAAKIVYYGPGLCGKTSNLSYIYAKTSPNSRGEMVSLETESDRTLFFDLLPIEVGTIGGFKTRLQLYTVPGQVFYNTTRKLVLKGVDGLVFVADSQRPMREANTESFQSLRDNLAELNLDHSDIPMVLQYNKRDLKNILTVEDLNQDLNQESTHPFYVASAINGDGVFETLKAITKLTLKKLRKRMAAPQATPGPKPRTTATPQVRPAVQPVSRKPVSISAAALARAAEEGVDADDFGGMGSEQEVADAAYSAEEGETVAAAELPEQPQPLEQPAVDAASVEPEPQALEVEPPPLVDAEPFARPEHEEPGVPDQDGGEPLGGEEPPPLEPAFDTGPEPELEPEPQLELESEPVPQEVELAPEVEPPEATPGAHQPEPDTPDSEMRIEFDQTGADVAPPPLKRVQVSNQMDILAELDGLRKQATMEQERGTSAPDLDLDSLLIGSSHKTRDIRRKIEKALNSDIFKHMHGLQLAIRIQNKNGETIHTLDPVSLLVDEAGKLEKLSLQFTVNLENVR
jgi:signal recognition particle receptor subunit beta